LQCASFNLGAASPADVSSQGADYAFSDDAADSLTASCAPVVPGGLYLPTSATAATSAAGDMSALAGASAAGLWTVTVEDLAPGGAALSACAAWVRDRACILTHACAHVRADAGFFDDLLLRLRGVNGEVWLSCIPSCALPTR
jgi:hypothetical protein